jgi:hypothetical protein
LTALTTCAFDMMPQKPRKNCRRFTENQNPPVAFNALTSGVLGSRDSSLFGRWR